MILESDFVGTMAYALSALKLEVLVLKDKHLEATQLIYKSKDIFLWMPTVYSRVICFQTLPFLLHWKLGRTKSPPSCGGRRQSFLPGEQCCSRQAADERVGETVAEACILPSYHVDSEGPAVVPCECQVLIVWEEHNDVGLFLLYPTCSAQQKQPKLTELFNNDQGLILRRSQGMLFTTDMMAQEGASFSNFRCVHTSAATIHLYITTIFLQHVTIDDRSVLL